MWHLPPIVEAHKVLCCGHCPWPHLNCENDDNQLWCWYPSGIVSTRTYPLKSGPRTAMVMHRDTPWELRRKYRPWPSPAPRCMHPQSSQLLRPDLSQLQKHPCPLGCTTGSEFTKLTAETINLWFVQLREDISALCPKSCSPRGLAMISTPFLCVVNPLVPVPRASKMAGTGSLRGGGRCMGKEAVVVLPASCFVFPLGIGASLVPQMVKNLPAVQETWV